MKNLGVIFGENIKAIRDGKGLTQHEFAEVLGLGLRSYQRYESGDRPPSRKALTKIAETLSVSETSLITPSKIIEKEELSSLDLVEIMGKISKLGPSELDILKDTLNELLKPVPKSPRKEKSG